MSKILPSEKGTVSSNIGRLDTDDDTAIEEAKLNPSSAPIQEMRQLHQEEEDDHELEEADFKYNSSDFDRLDNPKSRAASASSVTTEELQSLKEFIVEKQKTTQALLQEEQRKATHPLQEKTSSETQLEQQLAAFEQFLTLTESDVATLPPEKLKILVAQMEAIKEKSAELAAAEAFEEAHAPDPPIPKEAPTNITDVPPLPEEADGKLKTAPPPVESLSSPSVEDPVSLIPVDESSLSSDAVIFEEEDLRDLKALNNFTANYLKTTQSAIVGLSDADTSKKTALENQAKNLTKLLAILDDSNTPSEKLKSLKPLVDLMKQIEEKDAELAAARSSSIPIETIRDAKDELFKNFSVELQKIVSLA